MLKRILLFTIFLYQKTISPDHGLFKKYFSPGVCIYRPTCSDYAKDAIINFGALKGCWLACKRILRCHPWAKGGWDPIKKAR